MTDLYTYQADITAGGTVTVPPGDDYTLSQPLLLPLDTAVTLVGTGVTVTLDVGCPGGFLEFASSADYQTFGNITIRGFAIDASLVTADYTNQAVIGTTRLAVAPSYVRSGISWMNYLHDILIEDVDITLPASREYSIDWQAKIHTGVRLGSRQSSTSHPEELVPPIEHIDVERITVQRVTVHGGDMAVVIVANRGYTTEQAEANVGNPSLQWVGNRVWMDDITVIDCHHFTAPPPVVHVMWNAFHIGSASCGDSVLVSGCSSNGGGEGGFEVNGFDHTVIEHCTVNDSTAIGFMFYNFNDQVDPDVQTILFDDCRAINTGPKVYENGGEWPRCGFDHGNATYGSATGAVTFKDCTAMGYLTDYDFDVVACKSVTHLYSAPESTFPEASNPLFDGTLSLKVNHVEYAAYAGALQYETVAPGGFGAASFEVYPDGGVVPGFSATGGTVTTDGLYTVHKFTADDPLVCSGSIPAEVFEVGGGGGGASSYGAGAGAGGVRTGTITLSGSMPVVVGAGGNAGNPANAGTACGLSGGSSSIGGMAASGGGGGRSYLTAPSGSGGSGGGGSQSTATPGAGNIGAYTPPEGHAGGAGGISSGVYGAGGGGGAAEVGQNGTVAYGGDGGDGIASDLIERGTDVYYAGGGGGGVFQGAAGAEGAGGSGGGGAARVGGAEATGTNGAANTGGGGGGGGYQTGHLAGGAGGSGIVVVRYLTAGTSGGPFDIPTTFPELVNEAKVIAKHGTVILYEGHIVGDPTIAKLTDGESLIAVECGGLLDAAKYRQDYGETWVDTTYDNWQRHRASDKGFADTIDGKLRFDVNDGQVFTAGDIAGIIYRVNQGIVTSPDDGALALDFEYDLALASAAWHCDIWAAPYYVDTLDEADWTTGLWAQADTTAEGTAHVTGLPAGTRCIAFVSWVSGSGTSGAKRHAEITNLRVFCTNDNEGTEPRVDTAMVDCGVVAGLATTSDTETIGNPLKQCLIPPSTTRADGLDKLASMYEAPVDWGFWESSTLRVKKRLNSPADNVAIRALTGWGVTRLLPSFSPTASHWPSDWLRSGVVPETGIVYASGERFVLSATVGGGAPWLCTPHFAVTPGTDITFACHVIPNDLSGGGIFAAGYKFYDSDDVGIGDSTSFGSIETASTDATFIQGSVTVPVGAAFVAVSCRIVPGTGTAGAYVTGVEIGGVGTAQAAYLLDATTPAFDYDVHKYEEGASDYVRAVFTNARNNRVPTPSPSGNTWPTDWYRSPSTNVAAASGEFVLTFDATSRVPLMEQPVPDAMVHKVAPGDVLAFRIEDKATVPSGSIAVLWRLHLYDSAGTWLAEFNLSDEAWITTQADFGVHKLATATVPAGDAAFARLQCYTEQTGTGACTYACKNVSWHDAYPGGMLRTVCAPSEPPAGADVKVGILDLTDRGDMTVDRAFNVAKQARAWIDSTLETGTIEVFSPTVPVYAGGTKLAAYVRASEWVECKQVSDAAEVLVAGSSKPLWISSSHVDVDAGVTTLTIEPYPFDVAESDFGHAHMSRLRRWQKARRGMYRKQKAALRKAQSKENKTKLGSGHKRRIHYI